MILYREEKPVVVSINISKGGIPKRPVPWIQITTSGLAGDGHNHEKHYRPGQAVSLQDLEKLEELQQEGYSVYSGATGENITIKNLNVNALPVGTILEFSGGVVMELTKVRHPCYVLDAIDPRLKKDIIDRCGMYAQVLKEGILEKGEIVQVLPQHSRSIIS